MTTRSTTRQGRPTLLTPVVIEKLGQAVEEGLTRAQAAEVAGVNAGSFARWMTRGRAADQMFDDEGSIPVEEGPYWELYARIRKADVIRRAVKTVSEVPTSALSEEAHDVAPATVGLWARFRSLFSSSPRAAV